jgi:tight adherence protein C
VAAILLIALTGIFVSLAVLAGFLAWSMLERPSPYGKLAPMVILAILALLLTALDRGLKDNPLAAMLVTALVITTLTPYVASDHRRLDPFGRTRERPQLTHAFDPTLAKLTKLVPKSAKDMSRLQRRMARAGYPQASAAVYFSLAQISLTAICGFVALALLGPADQLHWVYAALIAAGAYLVPGFWVDRKIELRKKEIRNGLPDALDLLTVCVEAGSGLDQAITKTTDDLEIAHPALTEELRILTTEIRDGVSRIEAFRHFAQRTRMDDVREVAETLTESDRSGTSIGQALRIYSDTLRNKRRLRAKERATKVSVKLVFPLVFCLFPALYIVCFGPVALRIYRAMLGGT